MTTDCSHYAPLLEKHLSDEIDETDRGRLLEHTAACAPCAELVDLHLRLSSWEAEAADPSPADFLATRRRVLAALEEDPPVSSGWKAASHPRTSPGPWRGRLLAAAAAVALVTAAFVLGQASGTRAGRSAPQAATAAGGDAAHVGDPLLAGVERAALNNRRLRDAENAPYTISNVSLRDLGAGRVQLGFDLATRIDVTRSSSDPLVGEVLVQSLINPSPLGSRLKALDLAGDLLEPKVRDAIIRTMLTDPDLAVRIEASERLTGSRGDSAIDDAFLQVLATEESVHMRLLALDHLTREKVRPEALEEALRNAPPEPGSAVLAKANDYIQRF